MSTVDWNDFDTTRLVYGKPIPLKTGGSTTPVTYRQRDDSVTPIVIQTPRAAAPFGISTFVDEKNPEKPPSVSVSISFKGVEANPTIKRFHDFFGTLDGAHLATAKLHAATWFKQDKNKSTGKMEPKLPVVIDSMWTESIKQPKPAEEGGKYPDAPPTVKAKIAFKRGQIVTKIFNRNKDLITSEDVQPGSEIICLWECTGIWQVQGKFGCSWVCHQIKNYGGSAPQEYAMCTESDDEDADDDEPPSKRAKLDDQPKAIDPSIILEGGTSDH